MVTETSTNLELPYILGAQAQKHVTHNEALRMLDVLTQLSVQSASLSTPPSSPQDGQTWIVGAASTDAWAGKEQQLAAFQDGTWYFYPPSQGWLAFDLTNSQIKAYDGTGWQSVTQSPDSQIFGEFSTLGINATPDQLNRLAVKTDAVLISHDDVTPGSGDLQIKLNKNTSSNTASFVFQNNWSGRAEFGLSNSDDFSLKSSPDGATWYQSFVINAASGVLDFKNAPTFQGQTFWHAGNHGAASGLDSDTLDGEHGSFYQNASNLSIGTLPAQRLPYSMNQNMQTGDNVSFYGLGVGGATPDSTNKFSFYGTNLLYNSGGSIDATFNKNAASNDASFTFKTNYSPRALIGLLGNDDFTFKVSPDGSSFYTSISIDRNSGDLTLEKLFGSKPSFPSVSAGTLNANSSYLVPSPQSGSSDDVDTISGGQDGSILILSGTSGNTLTFQDSTGNLKLGGTRTLNAFDDTLMLVRRGGDWLELSYSNNG